MDSPGKGIAGSDTAAFHDHRQGSATGAREKVRTAFCRAVSEVPNTGVNSVSRIVEDQVRLACAKRHADMLRGQGISYGVVETRLQVHRQILWEWRTMGPAGVTISAGANDGMSALPTAQYWYP